MGWLYSRQRRDAIPAVKAYQNATKAPIAAGGNFSGRSLTQDLTKGEVLRKHLIYRSETSLYGLGAVVRDLFLASAISAAMVQGASAASATWEQLVESETALLPADSDMVRIWKDVLISEADAIRASGGDLYVQGKRTQLPPRGFRPTDFLSKSFEDERATYVVSIMLQYPPACDTGANSATAGKAISRCPVRLTIIPKNGAKTRSMEQEGGCGIWPSMEADPLTNKIPTDRGTFARFDGTSIEVTAIVGKKPVRGCDIKFEPGGQQ